MFYKKYDNPDREIIWFCYVLMRILKENASVQLYHPGKQHAINS